MEQIVRGKLFLRTRSAVRSTDGHGNPWVSGRSVASEIASGLLHTFIRDGRTVEVTRKPLARFDTKCRKDFKNVGFQRRSLTVAFEVGNGTAASTLARVSRPQ